jgi:hypothetical protein
VLDIEKPIVVGDQPARFGEPGFCPRIRSIDGQMDDFRDTGGPLSHDSKALYIPGRIGNNVDRDSDAERPSDL